MEAARLLRPRRCRPAASAAAQTWTAARRQTAAVALRMLSHRLPRRTRTHRCPPTYQAACATFCSSASKRWGCCERGCWRSAWQGVEQVAAARLQGGGGRISAAPPGLPRPTPCAGPRGAPHGARPAAALLDHLQPPHAEEQLVAHAGAQGAPGGRRRPAGRCGRVQDVARGACCFAAHMHGACHRPCCLSAAPSTGAQNLRSATACPEALLCSSFLPSRGLHQGVHGGGANPAEHRRQRGK